MCLGALPPCGLCGRTTGAIHLIWERGLIYMILAEELCRTFQHSRRRPFTPEVVASICSRPAGRGFRRILRSRVEGDGRVRRALMDRVHDLLEED